MRRPRQPAADAADARPDPQSLLQLRPDPQNRRRHSPRNVGMIVDALKEVGPARSIVIDEQNVVLAGNGVVEAATAAGLDKLRVVDVDGDTLIAVRRTGLTDAQKRRLALFDNRAGELADWNVEQVFADTQAGLDFAGIFEPDELAALLARVNGAQPAPPPQFPSFDDSLATEHRCPKCGYEWSGKSQQ